MDKFLDQERRQKFFMQAASNEGVYLRLLEGIPCSTIYPEPCLNKATVVRVRMLGDVLRIEPSPCRECAEKIAALYEK